MDGGGGVRPYRSGITKVKPGPWLAIIYTTVTFRLSRAGGYLSLEHWTDTYLVMRLPELSGSCLDGPLHSRGDARGVCVHKEFGALMF